MGRRSSLRHGRRGPYPFAGTAAPVTTLLAYGFTGAALGNAGTLSSTFTGLNLTRASAATVQTSASTVDSTPTTDQARIGSQGAAWGQGLVIEEARTNLEPHARSMTSDTTSGAPTITEGAATGPDGTAAIGTRVQASSGAPWVLRGITQPAGFCTASSWIRATSGTTSMQFVMGGTPNTGALGLTAAGTTWARLSKSLTNNNALTNFIRPDTRDWTASGGVVAAATDGIWDLKQFEAGQWPSEAIVTTGASATRAGERLWITSAATVIDTNRMGLAFTFVGKGTPAQISTGAVVYLWWIDASNNAFIDTAQKLNVQLGGVTVTSVVAIAWAAGDIVDVWVACGAGSNAVVEYRTNGGAKTVLLNTALAGNPSGASTIDILCSGTSNQLSCWLQSLTAYKKGQQPAWA
jgi:hypothetical protein